MNAKHFNHFTLMAALATAAVTQVANAGELLLDFLDAKSVNYSVQQGTGEFVISVTGAVRMSSTGVQLNPASAGRPQGITEWRIALLATERVDYSVVPLPGESAGKRLIVKISTDAAAPPALVGAADAPKAVGTNDSAKAAGTPLKTFQVDMPMSTSPALIVLGAAPTSIPRATTPREFALQLAKGVGPDGKLATGVSGEISIYRALNRQTLTVGKYQTDAVSRLLANTTLSFATPASSTTAGNVAIGLQTVWLDQLDPAANGAITRCNSSVFARQQQPFAETEDLSLEKPLGEEIPLRTAAETKPLAAMFKACFQDNAKRSGFRFATGLGQAWSSPDNTIRTLNRASSAYWATGSYTLGGTAADTDTGVLRSFVRSELIGHLRMHKKQTVVDPGDATKQVFQDTQIAAAKLRFTNNNENLAGLIEVSRQRSKILGLADEVVNRRVFGIEFRVGPDYWLNLGVGTETGRRDGKDARFALANVKFGSASNPIFKP